MHSFGNNVKKLPWSRFTCRALEHLKILGRVLLNLPTSICFPSLKIINLEFVIYVDNFSMRRLFSSCPVPEGLAIKRPSLKKILFTSVSHLDEGFHDRMVINAPSLEYFVLDVHRDLNASVDYSVFSPSLVEAGVRAPLLLSAESRVKLLRDISQVQRLLLSGSSTGVSLFELLLYCSIYIPLP